MDAVITRCDMLNQSTPKGGDKITQIIARYAISAGLQARARADIYLSNLEGHQRWMDVRVTAPPHDDKLLYNLKHAEGVKDAVPGIIPVIFSTTGHLAPQGQAVLGCLIGP